VIERLNAALTGRYRIDREIGRGGMATVYLADDLRHERKVALKVLAPELAAAVGAERFLTEIRTTANLRHPHILPLFDSGQVEGLLYYVMPLVEGESLRDRIDRDRQLPVDQSVKIAERVLHALDHAHRRGVVHRDVKPANILLQDGEPVVSDFGIALALSRGGERMTETGLSLGTPQYMSPEQAAGDEGVGPATDVWAVACVLYEMLTGAPPFTGTTPQAVLGKIISAKPEPVSVERRTTPPNVADALERALEKVPADRFGSAQEFAEALADPAYRYAQPVGSGSGPGRRSIVFVGAAAFVAGALVAAALFGLASPAGDAADTAAEGPVVGFKIPGAYGSALFRVIAISPDGSRIASGSGSLVVRSLRDTEIATQLSAIEGLNPFFSPDGEWIGYFAGVSANVMRVPVTGGTPSLITAGEARALGGSWAPDGTIVFATTEGLYRVESTGGEPELLAAPDPAAGELYFAWPEVLPGGEAVLFTIAPAEDPSDRTSAIAALDLESLQRTILLRGGSGPKYSTTGHLLYTSGGELFSVPFDPVSVTITGEPRGTSVEDIQLARGTGPEFDLSDNGTLVYVPDALARTRGLTLAWMGKDGSFEPIDVPARAYGYLRVSPDGSKVAVDIGGTSRDVHVLDLARLVLTRVTDSPREDFFAEWSFDGERLYFSSDREGVFDIYVQAADGSGSASKVVGSPIPSMLMDVLPSESGLLTAEQRESGRFDLVAWSFGDASRPEVLVGTSYQDMNGAVSPDGRWLAYASDLEGQWEVYVSAIAAGDQARWKASVAGGDHPAWSPEGDELYYRPLEGGLMVAAVRTAPRFEVSSVRELFPPSPVFPSRSPGAVSGRPYDVSPVDGRFLVRVPVSDTEDNGIAVVVNWARQLRSGAPD